MIAENGFKYSDTSSNDDVICDIFHDGRRLPSNEGQQDGGFVEIPEEEKFPPGCRRRAHVSEKVSVRVPEDAVKTENHLWNQ